MLDGDPCELTNTGTVTVTVGKIEIGGIQSGPSCERSRPFRQTLRVDALVMTQDVESPARFVGAA